jgi:hypothetical protein
MKHSEGTNFVSLSLLSRGSFCCGSSSSDPSVLSRRTVQRYLNPETEMLCSFSLRFFVTEQVD